MEYKTKAEPRAKADNISVFCSYDKIVKIENVKPNPANPNTHPEEQIKNLAQNIKSIGWRYPITISNQSGMIVKGHGRLMAAKYLGVKEVPVEYQNYSSEEEEMADLLFDNRIQELSEIDRKTLLNCFENYDTGNIPFELSGYTEEEYRDLASAFDEYEPKKKEESEETTEVQQKESTFKCCDFKKCCPSYGQKGCSRA
jgi:prophage lambdaMc01, DNA methyltransferase|nr:MAG TPA: ParB protein [Caudoviricetes sp.]